MQFGSPFLLVSIYDDGSLWLVFLRWKQRTEEIAVDCALVLCEEHT